MAIKEKKLRDFLERLAHSTGASGLAQEVEGLFKKDPPPQDDKAANAANLAAFTAPDKEAPKDAA
jgi:hypothetical protein